MGSRRKRKRGGESLVPQSRLAITSVGFLFLILFLFTTFRSLDMVVLSLLLVMVSAVGLVTAVMAKKKLRRHRGRLEGDSAAEIGYWGNLAVFVLSLLAFSWFFLIGVARGDFL